MKILKFNIFRRIFIRLFFICLFLFAGCGKQKNIKTSADNNFADISTKSESLTNFELLAAKHSDLPVPIGFKLEFASDNYLFYKGKAKLENILKFYNQELELAGWQVNNFSNNLEGLFVCKKPNKNMVLSVRQKASKLKLYFFVKKQNTLESKNLDLINSKKI